MQNNPCKIIILHKLPTPYNDMLFLELSKNLNVQLNVHHLWRRADNRPWSIELATGYPNRFMRPILGIDWPFLHEAVIQRRALFLVGDWGHLPALCAIIVRIMLKYPVSVWADTPQEQLPRSWPKRPLRKWFLHWLLRRLDVVFATGGPGMKTVIEMGANKDKVFNLPCYVDLSARRKWEARDGRVGRREKLRYTVKCGEDGLVVLMSGQCTHKKGFDIGLRALSTAIKRSDQSIGVLLAGKGPELDALRHLVDEIGIEDRVTFLGWLNPEEVDDAYGASDCLLHPARYDPFPLVVLEAMSWGLPVIGTEVCGSVQDRIVNGLNGFSVRSEDIDRIAEIIVELASDKNRVRRIGLAARATAEEWPVSRGVETVVQAAQKVISAKY